MPTDQPLDRRRSLRRSLVVVVALTVVAASVWREERRQLRQGQPALTSDTVESGLAEAGKPVRGGKLIYGLEADTAGGFCLPEGQLAISGMMVVRAIYDTLTVPNSKGEYVPYLAKSDHPQRRLHDVGHHRARGVKFHDGTQARRQGREEQHRRLPRQVSGPASRSSPGSRSATSVRSTLKATDGRRGQDEGAVGGVPGYLYGGSRFGIMAQAQLDDKKTCDRKLIGTGPFKFKSWQPNQKLEAVRNPHYWQIAPDGKPYPYADSIEFRTIPEEAQRVNASKSGTINVMHTSSTNDIGKTLTQAARRTARSTCSCPRTTPRSAISCSTRRSRRSTTSACARRLRWRSTASEINDVLADGVPTVADGPFSPGNVGYLKDTGLPQARRGGGQALVEEYVKGGHKAEFTLTLVADPTIIRLGALIQQQVAKAGITVKLRQRGAGPAHQRRHRRQVPGHHVAQPPRRRPRHPVRVVVQGAPSQPGELRPHQRPGHRQAARPGPIRDRPGQAQEDLQNLNREFAKKVWNIWLSYTLWAVAERPRCTASSAPICPRRGQAVHRPRHRSPGARHVDLGPVNRRAPITVPLRRSRVGGAGFTHGGRRSVTVDTSAALPSLRPGYIHAAGGDGTADSQESSDNSPGGHGATGRKHDAR